MSIKHRLRNVDYTFYLLTNKKSYHMMSLMASNPNLQQSLGGLEKTLNEYFGKKAPQLPDGVKDVIVNLAPWVTLILMILALPALLFLFGLATVLAPFGMMAEGARYGTSLVGTVVSIVSLVLEALAIPGLFARSIKGWRLVYWSTLVGFVASLVSFNVVGGLLSAVIGLYFLFQIRDRYK